ncbi:MAG: hypothetical protein ACTIKE_12120 [Sphingobacterium sp.]
MSLKKYAINLAREHKISKLLMFLFAGSLHVTCCLGQSYITVIIDAKHLAIVNENGAVRLASEMSHNSMLGKIQTNIDDINLNLSSMSLVQRMIYSGLADVNSIQKTGRSVMHVSRLLQEITSESAAMFAMAKDAPWLLLFAENTVRQLKDRGLALAWEVSNFVLKEGANVLMNYAKRDQLLRKIILELKVIRALLYSMQRSMFYAKINGIFYSANPYKDFINRDKRLAEDIIRNSKLLTP